MIIITFSGNRDKPIITCKIWFGKKENEMKKFVNFFVLINI